MKKVTIFIFFFFNVFALFLFHNHLETLTYAQIQPPDCVCNNPLICYLDNCSRKPKTDQNTFDESRYQSVCSQLAPWTYPNPPSINLQRYFCSQNQPDCCDDMKKYGDDRLCCYAERFFCHPSFCNGNGDNCGQYWKFVPGMTDRPEGYGCMKGPNANSMTPVYGSYPPDLPIAQSTNTPQPTNPPQTNPSTNQHGCPTTSTRQYRSMLIRNVNDKQPAHLHPDKNLSLRGYELTNNTKNIITYGGEVDSKAPQLTSLLDTRNPPIKDLYQVYDWSWNNGTYWGQKSALLTSPWPVTMMGLYSSPNSSVYVPDSDYSIGNGNEAFVLYAEPTRLTIVYLNNDRIVGDDGNGYAIHLEDFCVDPNLLNLYQSLNQQGRTSLPALAGHEYIGTTYGDSIKIAIRDSGQFMDPRAKDWWNDVSSLPTLPITRTPPPTHTQTPSGQSGSITPQPTPIGAMAASCLTIKNTYKPTCPKNAGFSEEAGTCIDFPQNSPLPYPPANHHNLLLNGTVPPNTDIYIVACVQTPEGFRCTAGSNDNNRANTALATFAPAFVNPLPPDIHQFAVQQGNPVRTNSNTGDLSVIVHSYTVGENVNPASPGTTNHVFFAVFRPPTRNEKPTAQPQGGSSPSYGTWSIGNINMNECGGVMWDPKGRAFDTVSLEPIPDVQVTLFDVNKTIIQPMTNMYLGVTQNPYRTKLNGEFNFYVPNGIYYLYPKKLNYDYPLFLNDVNPHFSKAYWCDEDVGYPLYFDQYPIPEQNKLVHCDIPLKPIGNPISNAPQLMSYEHFGLPGKTVTKFAGLVTHPLTIIELIGSNSEKIIDKTQSDKLGFWNLYIDNLKIPQNETLKVRLTKVSLVSGPTEEKIIEDNEFQPIPRYIEGYVPSPNTINSLSPTPTKNQRTSDTPETISMPTIPNADIFIQSGENKIKVGTTDEKGYIVIYPEQLPIMDYTLVAVPKTPTIGSGMMSPIQIDPVVVSPLQFIETNREYLAKNKINLLTAEKNGTKISHPLYSKFNTQKKSYDYLTSYPNNASNNQPIQKTTTQKPFSQPIGLIIVLVLFTATGLGGLFFFIKNRYMK